MGRNQKLFCSQTTGKLHRTPLVAATECGGVPKYCTYIDRFLFLQG